MSSAILAKRKPSDSGTIADLRDEILSFLDETEHSQSTNTYKIWLAKAVLNSIDDPSPPIPHVHVMAQLNREIKFLEKKHAAKSFP